MKFGPNNEILSKSVNFGQPETLRLQIIFLKKYLEESFPGGFSLPSVYKYFLWYLYQIEIEQFRQWGSTPKSVGSVEEVDIDVTGDKFDAGQRESADRR